MTLSHCPVVSGPNVVTDGDKVGLSVGLFDGLVVGLFVGLFEGLFVGLFVGLVDGLFVGECVSVSQKQRTCSSHSAPGASEKWL